MEGVIATDTHSLPAGQSDQSSANGSERSSQTAEISIAQRAESFSNAEFVDNPGDR